MIENKLGKAFGLAVSFAGYFFIFTAILAATQSIFGILFVLPGILIGFSYSGIRIKPQNNQLKYYTRIFWIFEQGKWQNLSDFKGLILLKNRNVYTAHSRSNRTVQVKRQGYIIYLVRKDRGYRVPVKHCKSLDEGKIQILEYSQVLNIPLVRN